MRQQLLVVVVVLTGSACGGVVGDQCLPLGECTEPSADGGRRDGGGLASDGGNESDSGTTSDSGTPSDGGLARDGGKATDGGAATSDGGAASDSGTSTSDGGSVRDGGQASDGGSASDSGASDSGTKTDAGTPLDSGTPTFDAGGNHDGGTTPPTDGGVPAFIAAMAADSVYEIPNSTPDDVFPSFSNRFGSPTAAFYAWSGAAYDPNRQQLIVWGGGHNDYNGNEVYAFPVYGSAAPRWKLLTQPSAPQSSMPTESSIPENADGTPASTHTYGALVVDPFADVFVAMGQGSVFGAGSEAVRIRALNLTTRQWDVTSVHPTLSAGSLGSSTAFDPARRIIYRKAGNSQTGLDAYDVATRTLSTRSDGLRQSSIDFAIAYDSTHQLILAIGGYDDRGPVGNNSQVVVWNIGGANSTSIPAAAFTPAGFPAALVSTKLGLEFHPPSGTFVALANDGSLWRIAPPANPMQAAGWSITRLTPTGPALPDSGGHGIYGRFRWAPYPGDPSHGVFVTIQSTSETPFPQTNVFLFKPGF